MDAASSFSLQDSLQQLASSFSIQDSLQQLLSTEQNSWSYAIFWQSSTSSDAGGGPTTLAWGDGYYIGETRRKTTSSSPSEQEHRQKVLRELSSLVSGQQEDDDAVEEVTDLEWFFLDSMSHSFTYWSSSGSPDRLSGSACHRARQACRYGIRTLKRVPVVNGVVELGSTEVIPHSSDLVRKVVSLFDSGIGFGKGFSSDTKSTAVLLIAPSAAI